MNIYVGNLPYTISEDELKQAFEAFGEVSAAKIVVDKMNNDKSKGFGFVEMPDEEQANNAIEALNGSELKGRNIVVNKSRPKTDAPRGGNGGGARRPSFGGNSRGNDRGPRSRF
jgi:RNA recognition motif-containing protein